MNEIFDFAATLKHETEAAFLVDYEGKDYWLPRSQTENYGDGTWAIPLWLATEKGMV